MSETLGTEVLLAWLAETCDARRWTLHVHYYPRHTGWTVCVFRHESVVIGSFYAEARLFQEALADCWAQVQRWCREEAARGSR